MGKFWDGFVIKVWGEGKNYQFRLRMGNNFDGVAYRHYFQTNNENWRENFVCLSANLFLPTEEEFFRMQPHLIRRKFRNGGF
ncbi:MAG: hypothetical protein CM1200mP16_14790 [Nitrospina sp.]|nr:MAG: hypothetical protein CM1200mP16_14790 [Nitrospina sp.]